MRELRFKGKVFRPLLADKVSEIKWKARDRGKAEDIQRERERPQLLLID
jgi:hypothetical protein